MELGRLDLLGRMPLRRPRKSGPDRTVDVRRKAYVTIDS